MNFAAPSAAIKITFDPCTCLLSILLQYVTCVKHHISVTLQAQVPCLQAPLAEEIALQYPMNAVFIS